MIKLLAFQIPDAQGTPIQIQGVGNMPQGGVNELPNAMNGVFDLLILTAILLCLMYLIWGGIDWMLSGGDKQKIDRARGKIAFAIIGLIIVFLAFLIINAAFTLFFGNKLLFSH
jgi:TRAP-type C4-dicarboxylate transport system permease small subunit